MSAEYRLIVKNCIEALNKDMETLSQLFYKELFHLDMSFKSIFSGNVVFLNRKFINMMMTFKNVKHLEKISPSVAKMGERHILQYHAEIQHFPIFKQALLKTLKIHLKEAYTQELETAWKSVFDEVVMIMKQAMEKVDTAQILKQTPESDLNDLQLLHDIGGEEVILAVHKRLYDYLFVEPWLETFFFGKSKEALIKKQTDFMLAVFNGENRYTGDTPAFVHMHMFITDEMAEIRSKILHKAILEQGLSENIAQRWLKIDNSFRSAIVKKSIDECVLKCKGQLPVIARKPIGYRNLK